MAEATIDWNTSGHDIDAADWDLYLKRYRYSTVFHNWSYGSASAEHDGLELLRGYVRVDGRVIGLVAAFIKKGFLLGRTVRVIRGPIFESNVPLMVKVSAYRAIKHSFPLLRGNWCTLMPELLDTDAVRTMMAEAGFQRIMVGYQTFWLDLRREESDLWNRLRPRWRNQARKAMASDLAVTFDDAPDWLLDRYEDHKRAKGYNAPAAGLLRKLDDRDVSVATAWRGDRPVAATLFVRHGQCATYQVGWTSDEGRMLNAHNLLLWRHLLQAKDQGMTALDLGGVDPETAPGVAHFKSGLGGTPATLAGTFL